MWEKTLPKYPGRTWGEDVLKVAQSQMNYHESVKNYQLDKDGETKRGYNRYGVWYGGKEGAYSEWSTKFVSFCLNYAGIPQEAVPRHGGAFGLSLLAEDMGLLEDYSYTPEPGDIVFLRDEDCLNVNRTAIVASVTNMIENGEKIPCITIIEGDRNDAVAPFRYALDDEIVEGYISIAKA